MSLLDKLTQYSKEDVYPFHMPGHKRQICFGLDPYAIDITEIEGMDDLHDPEGIILEEMQRASRLYKSDESFLLVNGSTVGNLAAVYATCYEKDAAVLVARNCHKSVYNAVKIAGCKAEYVYPEEKDGIFEAVKPETVKAALEGNNSIKAVVITSPTYEGYVSDIRKIAETAHNHGAVLIVDAAHGAHLGFSNSFPKSPIEHGADIVVMSLHKTLPAMTQTALMHVTGNLVDRGRIREALDIFETSSPSYVLMASISRAFDEMEKEGVFENYANSLEEFYIKTKMLKSLEVIDEDVDKKDPSKIVIRTAEAGLSGPEFAKICREKYAVEFEMSSFDYVIAMTSIADSKEGFERLSRALEEIDENLSQADNRRDKSKGDNTLEELSVPEKVFEPGQVKFLSCEEICLENSAGRVAAMEICLYPPGAPLVASGERIDRKIIDKIESALENHIHVTGIADGKIRVVRE